MEHEKCVWFSLQLLTEIFLIRRRIRRDTVINVHRSWQIFTELEFFRHFQKVLKYQIPLKSVKWEPSCSMRTDRWMDGQTDMTKLTVAPWNFAKAPEDPCYAGEGM